MSLETLEFIIHPDGRVEEKVTGVVGVSCSAVTAAIEAHLGRVVSQQPTSEFFAQADLSVEPSVSQSTAHPW
jgi:hypothetical protein